jgi:hypothetical protein
LLLAGLAALAMIGGCESDGAVPPPSSPPSAVPSSEPSLSSTDLPTRTRPVTPPSTPTDQVTGVWVRGTATEAATGCLDFAVEDGRRLNLVRNPEVTVPLGIVVRLRVVALPRAGACGDPSWAVLDASPG